MWIYVPILYLNLSPPITTRQWQNVNLKVFDVFRKRRVFSDHYKYISICLKKFCASDNGLNKLDWVGLNIFFIKDIILGAKLCPKVRFPLF